MSVSEVKIGGWRYERKFVCEERADLRAKLISWLRTHPARLWRPYPPRLVNNLYFETGDWASLEANLAGISDRAKLRLRWYGEGLKQVEAVLELKQKRAELGRKLSLALATPVTLAGLSWEALRASLMRQPLGELLPWVEAYPLPALVNQYLRDYYVTGDGLVRITLDSKLATWDQTRNSSFALGQPEPRAGALVVEAKANLGQEAALEAALVSCPLTSSAHSKYATGAFIRGHRL